MCLASAIWIQMCPKSIGKTRRFDFFMILLCRECFLRVLNRLVSRNREIPNPSIGRKKGKCPGSKCPIRSTPKIHMWRFHPCSLHIQQTQPGRQFPSIFMVIKTRIMLFKQVSWDVFWWKKTWKSRSCRANLMAELGSGCQNYTKPTFQASLKILKIDWMQIGNEKSCLEGGSKYSWLLMHTHLERAWVI